MRRVLGGASAAAIGYMVVRGYADASHDAKGAWRALGASIAAVTTLCDYRLAQSMTHNEIEAAYARSRCHQRGAQRARAVCEASGGMYLKAAQLVANLAGLPEEYANELSLITDSAPALPFETVKALIEGELGMHSGDVFELIEHEPIVAGSLAVVHRAKLQPHLHRRLPQWVDTYEADSFKALSQMCNQPRMPNADACIQPTSTSAPSMQLRSCSSSIADNSDACESVNGDVIVDADEVCTCANAARLARVNEADPSLEQAVHYPGAPISLQTQLSQQIVQADGYADSIAHASVPQDDGWVAIKVQRPDLGKQLSGDLRAIHFVLSTLATIGGVDVRFIVPELREQLVRELSFDLEAQCAEQVHDAFEDDERVKVPRVVHSFSTNRVLTMEYIDGCRADDLQCMKAMHIKPSDVASILSDTFGRMFTCVGLVHGDPHAGNLRVRLHPQTGQPQLCLLDHGLYVQLDDDLRHDMCRLWRALAVQNERELEHVGSRLGVGNLLPMLLGGQRRNVAMQSNDVAELMRSVPRESGALLRANVLCGSLVKKLAEGDKEVERQRLFALARYAILGLEGREIRPADMLPWDKWLKWQARAGLIEARFRVLQAAVRATSRFTSVAARR